MKVGDLIRFNEVHRGLHNDEAIGIVVGHCLERISQRSQYMRIYCVVIQQEHDEFIDDLEVISEYRK